MEEEQRREVERADMVVVVGRTAEHQALPYTLREHTTTHKKTNIQDQRKTQGPGLKTQCLGKEGCGCRIYADAPLPIKKPCLFL